MGTINLEDYITVKVRKQKFYIEHPDGRIIAELINNTTDSCLFKASCYKNGEDQEKGLPIATGYAQEFKDFAGVANKTSWLENCEESAVGRCLDNAGLSVNKKCSREEIEAAERNEKALAAQADIKSRYFQYIKKNFKKEEDRDKQIEKAKQMTVAEMDEILARQ